VAKTVKKIRDEQEKYTDAVRSNTNDNINRLRELQREYQNTIKKIVETRDEELKNIEQRKNADKVQNTEQFAKDQAEKFAESLKKVIELQ
jgi:DNA repair ATPase RecN